MTIAGCCNVERDYVHHAIDHVLRNARHAPDAVNLRALAPYCPDLPRPARAPCQKAKTVVYPEKPETKGRFNAAEIVCVEFPQYPCMDAC